ncbi:hypothetical protein SAMN05421771_2387 [Granulicella pectinivorans]|uniref:Probable membrane transporter protein n=1 Tax=Granulicella pectinivorans TaxID=474950 RepID=A0A1I6MDU4_9BACT|nr:sulfite exporter TauE/SafE family protein [Granulicella pectinivorans]SFS13758.1 hypothetical protein SAMN05421771_2387 [Granulicella pectinivorans]
MHGTQLVVLVVIFFMTSAISVVTGSTSLITVPAMLYFGVAPRTALATNMFALTFLSLGASLPSRGNALIDRRRLPILALLTSLGSIVGAVLLLFLPARSLSLIVPFAMIGVALFSTVYRKAGGDVQLPANPRLERIGYGLTLILGIYGGFFSGGYVTLLTALFVATFQSSFREAIATTKVLNVFSSSLATAIFMWKGLVDYRLGSILALTMFLGAALGMKVVARLADKWIRRVFLTAVWALGLKALLVDLLGRHSVQTQPRSSGANPL